MSFHDAYLRRTPLEAAFPGAAADGGAIPLEAASLREYGVLSFHLVPFLRAGCPTFLADTALCRALAGAWSGAGAPVPPAPAGYVQLPRQLFWVQAVPDVPPEPVDGFFWTVAAEDTLHVLVVAGLRDGRAGLSAVPVAEAPLADAPGWLHATVRGGGADFATTLPGGELQGLYSLTTAGEVLKLAARLFAHLAGVPGAARPGPQGPEGAIPAPSRLAYRRVTLEGEA